MSNYSTYYFNNLSVKVWFSDMFTFDMAYHKNDIFLVLRTYLVFALIQHFNLFKITLVFHFNALLLMALTQMSSW